MRITLFWQIFKHYYLFLLRGQKWKKVLTARIIKWLILVGLFLQLVVAGYYMTDIVSTIPFDNYSQFVVYGIVFWGFIDVIVRLFFQQLTQINVTPYLVLNIPRSIVASVVLIRSFFSFLSIYSQFFFVPLLFRAYTEGRIAFSDFFFLFILFFQSLTLHLFVNLIKSLKGRNFFLFYAISIITIYFITKEFFTGQLFVYIKNISNWLHSEMSAGICAFLIVFLLLFIFNYLYIKKSIIEETYMLGTRR